MTDEQVQMTLAIARSVLADPSASADRKDWADDVFLALEHGDIAAAKRIGWFEVREAQRVEA